MRRSFLVALGITLAACQAATPSTPTATPTPTPPPTDAPAPTNTPQLTPTPAPTAAPTATASPEPKLIAFDRATVNGFQLEVVPTSGGNPRPLLRPDMEVPRWSPDGQWIAVANALSESDVHTVLVRADGSESRDLVVDPRMGFGVVAWTPDGEWLACEAWGLEDESLGGVYVMKSADGSGLRRIADRGIPGRWSADGKTLAFSVVDGDEQHLAVVNFDGTGFKVLGSVNVGAYPGFMPDGTIYDTTEGKMGIFDLEGNLLRTIEAPGGDMNEAALSPDGTQFVFMYFEPNKNDAIATMNVDGSNVQIVVRAFDNEQTAPDWQP